MEHILNLEQVKKYYGGNSGNITKAVDGISMYVDKGEFVAIMGVNITVRQSRQSGVARATCPD